MRGVSKVLKVRDIRRSWVGGELVPFSNDLAFDYNSRSDSTINEKDGVDTAAIVGGYLGDFDGANFVNGINKTLAVGDIVTNYCKIDSSSNVGYLFGGDIGDLSGLYQAATYIAVYNNNQGGFSNTLTIDYRDDIWHKFEIRITSLTTCDFYVDDVFKITFDKSLTSVTSLMSRETIGKLTGEVSLFTISNTHYYALNNHSINSIDGVAAIWNGTEAYILLNDVVLQSTKDALNNGYYLDGAGNKIINPQYAHTTETQFSGGKLHNFIDSFIDFNPTNSADARFDIFDRSNATIFKQAARDSGYYDATNPTLFHISEVNFDTLQTYYEDAYKSKNFDKILTNYCEQKYIDEILVYNTKKVDADLIKVLDWAKYFCPSRTYQLDAAGNLQLNSNGIPIYS